MISEHENLYPFLKAARGNWHNALYVKCGHSCCPYGARDTCQGFLFAAGADGTPLLIPTETFQALTGESVDADECQGILWQHAFISAYAIYIEWHVLSDSDCPLKQLSMTACRNL